MHKHFTLVAVILTFAALAARCAADDVDDFVEAERRARKIPGLALLVVKDGQTVKCRGYGLANVEHQVPVTAETIFQSGSVGKQFTATAVMMLVEEGRLQLDDSIRRHLTDAPEAWQPITVRQLLSHTAGLGGYPSAFDFRRDYSEDELLKIVYATPLSFAPGTGWQYSNLGYVTLGILIHKVAGVPCGEYLDQRVFKPLGMTATRVISESDIVPHRAAGYRLVDGELKNQQWVSPTMNATADGSLYLNLMDFARWDAALREQRLLAPATCEQMWTPAPLLDGTPNSGNYGFGWVRRAIGGRAVVEHGGAWQGFTSHIARYLDDKLTVVVLANLASDAKPNPSSIGRAVAAMYIPALAAANEDDNR